MVKNKINGYSLLLTGNFALNYSNIFGTADKDKRCGKCSPKKDITSSKASELEEKQKKQKEENDKKFDALNKKIQELLNAQDKLKSDSEKTMQQVTINKEENDKKIQELKNDVNSLNDNISKKKKEIDEQMNKISDKSKNEVNNLKIQYDNACKIKDELLTKIAENDNKIENFKKQQEDFNEKLKTASEQNKNKINTELENINQQIKKLEDENKENIKAQELKNNEVKTALENLNKKDEEVYGKVKNLQKTVEFLENINIENQKKINKLTNLAADTNIKGAKISDNFKVNFVDNKEKIEGTKDGKYTHNSIVYISEQLKEMNGKVNELDINKEEDANNLLASLKNYYKSTAENIAANFNFDITEEIGNKLSNQVTLQFDFDIKDMKLSDFLQNYIIYNDGRFFNCLKTYLNNFFSAELYIDDINCTYNIDDDNLKPNEPKENCIYLDGIEKFRNEYNSKTYKSRFIYQDILFDTIELILNDNSNTENLKERIGLKKEIAELNKKIEELKKEKEKLNDERCEKKDKRIDLINELRNHLEEKVKESKSDEETNQLFDKIIEISDYIIESISYKMTKIDNDIADTDVETKKLCAEIDKLGTEIDKLGIEINNLSDEIIKIPTNIKIKEDKIEKLDKHYEERLKYFNTVLYKLTDRMIAESEMKEVLKHSKDKNYDEYLLDYFITNFGKEKIKDGKYHVIFRNINGKFDNFSIVRS